MVKFKINTFSLSSTYKSQLPMMMFFCYFQYLRPNIKLQKVTSFGRYQSIQSHHSIAELNQEPTVFQRLPIVNIWPNPPEVRTQSKF